MTPERWQQVEAVFQAALDRPPEARAAFLSDACASDEDLAREATQLIAAYDQAADFIETPAIAQDAQVLLSRNEPLGTLEEIGPYRIVKRLGGGGMGEIYLGHDSRLERQVALKVLPLHFVSDEERLRRFKTEARAASALNHTNILTIYEVGQTENVSFIATEYIDGVTIRERINAGDLSIGEVLQIADQLLDGLRAAHAAAIIHRDIKPENVMQRRDGVVKILDFGIAKLLEPAAEISASGPETSAGLMLGTLGYMSPEQVRGLLVDERTDIWSAGVVLYEMLAGRRPFSGKTNADTLVAILERDADPLFPNDLSQIPALGRLQLIAGKALQKDPHRRYQTAAEMRADLKKISGEFARPKRSRSRSSITLRASVSELQNNAAGESLSPPRRRAAALLIFVLIITLTVFAGSLYQRLRDRTRPNIAESGAPKSYLRMTEAEKLAFVDAQEQRISSMMGDRPEKLNDEALRVIKTHLDSYLARQPSEPGKAGTESLRDIYGRAPEYVPTIAQAFAERKIPVVIGIYVAMIESAYRPCYENEIGAKGLFQFLPATAQQYGVARPEMCDVQKVAPAAAHYIADRMAELGDDAQSMTLVLLSYNRGPDAVRESLRRLREIDAHYERNFWTLLAHRDKLDETFQKESASYVPAFFAAAIIGENPDAFDLQMPALSTFAQTR